MAVCPRGHASDTEDFCDECGLPMDGAPESGSVASAPAAPPAPAAASNGTGETCPWCGTPRDGRFCEEDGYDFVLAPAGPAPTAASPAAPAPVGSAPVPTAAFPSPTGVSDPTPAASASEARPPDTAATGTTATRTGWTVRVEADRRYFETVLERRGPDIETVTFPTYYPSTEVTLTGDEMRIGRRRASATTRGPEIDLTGPPLDPGVSRLHAVLLAGPSGWSVLDPGSTNGTTINYADEPIATDTPVPVTDGDRIHVGAYTTLVVVREG